MKSATTGPSSQSSDPRAPKIILVRRKRITEELIKMAVDNCTSASECARYLSIKYTTFKRHADKYKYPGTDLSYFEYVKFTRNDSPKKTARNSYRPGGLNIPKKVFTEEQIIHGDYPLVTPVKIRKYLVQFGYLSDCCHHCGYNEKRFTDGLSPIVLNFKDGNVLNKKLDNMELLCYNCYFMLGIPIYDYGKVQEQRDENGVKIDMRFNKNKDDSNKIYLNELLEDVDNI